MLLNKKDIAVIIKYLKPYKKIVKITVVFVILENVTSLVLPVIYGKIIDIATQGNFFENTIYLLLAFWAAMEMLNNWFLRQRTINSHKISYGASADLINNSVRHLVDLPLNFHKNRKIGEIIQRFSRADSYLYGIIESTLFNIFPSLITAFLAFIIILQINWLLALIYAIFISGYALVTFKKTKPIIEHQKKLNKVFEKLYGDIFDRTPNIISIKSNSAEKIEFERNIDTFKKGSVFNAAQTKMWMRLSFWQHFIFTIGFVSLFGIGVYLIGAHKITIGQFIMLVAYINMTSGAIKSLGGQYKRLQEGLMTIQRSEKIFTEITEDYNDPKATMPANFSGNIKFQNIYFSYDKEDVLKDISFEVKAGQMVAIVGRSGEGKSTLVDLISRYNIPQKGKVIFDGIDIQKIKLKNLRDQIAIVPQEIDLFNDTIKNNIAYSRVGANNAEIKKAAKAAHCHEFIEKFPKKYEQVVGEKGVKLSTGQKQRVAIARAILRNPKILILDEATSALDSESEKYVQEALEEVMKNRTTLIIAHRLSTIRKADLILVIEDGKIVESGDHQELFAHGGVYKKLSELQQINV